MRMASTPPSIMPRACSAYASRSTANGAWPSEGSLVPGPTEPMTNRGCSGVDQACADSAAIRAPACASS